MRILWVKMGGLWPSTTGGRVRSLQIVSALSRHHRVTLVTTHGSGDDPEGLARQLPDCHQVVSIPYDVPKRGSSTFPLAVARSWFSSYPVDLWKWRVAAVRDTVQAHHRRRIRSTFVVSDFLFAAAERPARRERVPVVLFEHNVEYLIWKRLSALERNPFKKLLFEIEWRKLRQQGSRALPPRRSHDRGIRRRSRAAGRDGARRDRPARFRPASIRRISRLPDAPQIPARLVFSGSMDWHPNEDAVIYFGE